jgi:uncharacterized membrane protein
VRTDGDVRTHPPDARPAGDGGRTDRREPWLPSFLLGVGLGGFVDGIVLHQLMQWHHMLTATEGRPATTIAGLEDNVVADGLFHVATWVCVVVAVWLGARATRAGRPWPSGRRSLGFAVMGWGAFNLVEGVVDHHILRVHHVRDDVAEPLPWDLAFLASGLVLVLLGWWLATAPRRTERAARR